MTKKYLLGGLIMVCALFGVQYVFAQANPITDGMLLKSPKHTAVYQYQYGTRRPFASNKVYYTWYQNFENVTEITVKEMEEIKLGNPMSIKPDEALLKFPLNPRIYSVGVDSDYGTEAVLRHIPHAGAATALFGDDWEDMIIELPELYYLFYVEGGEISFNDDFPHWINTKNYELEQYSLLTDGGVWNSLVVKECVDNDVKYYYISEAETDDAFDTLYDETGEYMCTPDGGFDGEGNNDCTEEIQTAIDNFVCEESFTY